MNGKLQKHFLTTSCLALMFLVLPIFVFAAGETESFWTSPIQTILWTLVTTFFGMLVYIGAAVLNFAINEFVLGFGATFLHSGVGVAVNNTWVIIRDFMNLFFIFGLIYIGLRMILDSSDSNTRRWLINLILAALLINFSLFVTKAVIDFSNQLSAEIAVAGLGATYDSSKGVYESDVGQKFMERMGIITIFSAGQPAGSGYGYIFGTAILFLITAFVFGAGGILLIVRFAVLNLFLVFSAVMFASWIIPGLGDTMQRYWKSFLKRCFFAPIYLIMLYLAFQIIGGLQQSIATTGTGGTSTNFANPNYSAALGADPSKSVTDDSLLGTMPFFFLVCVFMILALVAANKIGADGADKALSIGKSWGNKLQRGVGRTAGAATAGASASLLRNTAGRYADRYANSDAAKEKAAKGLLGRAQLGLARYGAGASFDARRVGGVGKTLGVGEGVAGGYKKRLEEDAKRAKKYADSLGTVDLDSEEGKAKVAAATAENKARAEEAEARAEAATSEFAEDKMQSEATLTDAINALTSEISDKETALNAKVLAGTITEKERAEAQQHIADQRARLAERNKNLEYVKAKDEAIIARKTHERIEAGGGSPEEKAKASEALQKAEADWAKAGEVRAKELEHQAKTAREALDNAEANAKAAVKYERQIAFIKQQQQSADRWALNKSMVGGAAGSGALGLAGGLLGGALYAGVGAAAVSAKSASYANIVKELEKEYGKDGTKKMKKDNRIKKKREQAEAEKDLDDTEEKKDEAKKEEK